MNLLSYEELLILRDSLEVPKKVEILKNSLNEYMFIYEETLYILNKEIIIYEAYTMKSKRDEKVRAEVEKLICNSLHEITKEERKQLKEKEKRYIALLTKLPYLNSLITELERKDIDFDSDLHKLHFKNGYLNVTNFKFKKRKIGKHFITKYIKRDYTTPHDESVQYIKDVFKKIYVDPVDLNYIFSVFGKALTGESPEEQKCFIKIGDGSSSKSFVLCTVQYAIGPYFVELSSDALQKGNNNVNKILNELDRHRGAKIVWINEISTDKKIDDALFKKFIDGTVKTVKLFKEGNFSIKLQCKLIITCNEIPKLKIDSGTKRRIVAYEHKSLFVEDAKKVNENNKIFLKDSSLLKKIAKNDDYLNALVYILIEHYQNSIIQPVKVPKNVIQTTQLIVGSNDDSSDFIEKCLIITNDEKDRIGKEEMKYRFLENFPEEKRETTDIISTLKQNGIKYNGVLRCNGLKGCFIGVKFKDEENNNNDSMFLDD